MAARAADIRAALAAIFGAGGGAAFGSLTVQHHKGQALADVLGGLRACMRAVNRDGTVRRLRKALGVVGMITTLEILHGENGWHPHLHPLYLFARPVTDAEVETLQAATVRAWRRAAAAVGCSATPEAQHLHAVSEAGAVDALSAYVTKGTYRPAPDAVAWEMTGSGSKHESKGRSVWALLAAVHEQGDADALDLVHEYERATKGVHSVQWSRGLRDRLGLDDERSDEDIAAESIGTAADEGMRLSDWAPVRARWQHGPALLSAVGATGNWAAGQRYCDEHGIEWGAGQ